jgi:hypothetical protein
MQTNPENKVEFESISHERYVSTLAARRDIEKAVDNKANERLQGVRGLHLRQHDITLLLRELHQLGEKTDRRYPTR